VSVRGLRGQVALVTGASSGIGAAAARALAARGATVVGVARRVERLREESSAWRRHAPESFPLVADLAEPGAPERAVHETLARLGRLDVLVNNAGISKHKQLYHVTAQEAEHVMRVNFLACVAASFAAIPPMLRQGGGTIVNVSSFAARVVPPRESVYAASKAAMDAFTEGLWQDLSGSRIHAGLVIVGPIDTEIWQKLEEPPAYRGRRHPPERVAEAILEVVERRRHQVTVPRRSLPLAAARLLRLVAPGVMRRALQRMDPVPQAVLDDARRRAEAAPATGQDRAPE
jgi:short-subunit dehydrogenase